MSKSPAIDIVDNVLNTKNQLPAYHTRATVEYDCVDYTDADYIEACRILRSKGYWCNWKHNYLMSSECTQTLTIHYDRNPVKNFIHTYITG
jgi:hypothetical protein